MMIEIGDEVYGISDNFHMVKFYVDSIIVDCEKRMTVRNAYYSRWDLDKVFLDKQEAVNALKILFRNHLKKYKNI